MQQEIEIPSLEDQSPPRPERHNEKESGPPYARPANLTAISTSSPPASPSGDDNPQIKKFVLMWKYLWGLYSKAEEDEEEDENPDSRRRSNLRYQQTAMNRMSMSHFDRNNPNEDVSETVAAQDARLTELYHHGENIINPDSKFRRRWDILQAMILVYISLVVPVRVGYKLSAEGAYYVLELTFDVYFYIDVVLNFFTGYHDDVEGVVVMNPKLISKNYISGWLSLDLIACLPIDLIFRILEHQFLCSFEPGGCQDEAKGFASGQLIRLVKLFRLFRLMKLLRLMRLSRLLERYQDELFHLIHLISVIKLAVVLLYLGHIFGCFFYFFSTKEWRTSHEIELIHEGKMTPWILELYDDSPCNAGNFLDRYIASMYWAFTTMTTVGYGDISANTRAERVFAILGMIMGGFVFSGIISTMSEVLQAINLSKKAKRHKIDCVSAFIRDAHLPSHFTKSVLSFFRRQSVKAFDERSLLMELPYELRHGILEHTFRDIIVKVPLFDVNGDGKVDDHVFVTELCSRMQRVSFTKGSLIFQRGELARNMLIICVGLVEVMDGKLSQVITVLDPGSYFGEGAVLGDILRRENMRARTTCELCRLELEDIKGLLTTYPHLTDTLRATREARMGLFDGDEPLDFTKLKKIDLRQREKYKSVTDIADQDSAPTHQRVLFQKVTPRDASENEEHEGIPPGHVVKSSLKSSFEDSSMSIEPLKADILDMKRQMAILGRNQEDLSQKLDKILDLFQSNQQSAPGLAQTYIQPFPNKR